MIRINLLPVRAARKKENIRRQVSIFFLTIVFLLTVMGYLTMSLNAKISEMNSKIETAQKELKKYKAINKKVKKLKNDLARLRKKKDIIEKLRANRTAQVQMMDALTQVVVPGKMWLTSLEAKEKIQTVGIAMDNETIADFMTRLEGSPYFRDVDLIAAKQVILKKDKGRKFKQFTITCKSVVPKPPKPPTKP